MMAESTDISSDPEKSISSACNGNINECINLKKEVPLNPDCNKSKDKIVNPDGSTSDDQSMSTSCCDDTSNQDSPADNGQPQFYIEVDAMAVANLKMGTQYTLVPMDQTRHISEVEITGSHDSTCSIEEGIKESNRWDSLGTAKRLMPCETDFAVYSRASDTCMTLSYPDVLAPSTSKAIEVHNGASGDAPNNLSLSEPSILNLSNSLTNSSGQHHHNGDHNPKNLSYTPLMPVQHMSHQPMSLSRFDSSRHHHQPIVGSTPPISSGFPTHMHPSRIYGPGAPMLNPLSHPPPTHTHTRSMQPLNHSWSPYGQGYAGQSYHSGMMNLNSSSSMSGTPSSGNGSNVSLSGDEVDNNSDYPRNLSGMQQVVGPLDNLPYYMPFNGRENHNEKERKRRSRIKNACQTLRTLVPGLSEKTDKATVFEFTVQYVLHLKRNTGPKYDKDFMEKYSPY